MAKLYYTFSPLSFRLNLLNLTPLGSVPTYVCTYSVPNSLIARAYSSGFMHDCKQNGSLVSPTECLKKREGENLKQTQQQHCGEHFRYFSHL